MVKVIGMKERPWNCQTDAGRLMATRETASAAGVDLKRSASFYSPAGSLLFVR